MRSSLRSADRGIIRGRKIRSSSTNTSCRFWRYLRLVDDLDRGDRGALVRYLRSACGLVDRVVERRERVDDERAERLVGGPGEGDRVDRLIVDIRGKRVDGPQ